MRNYSKENLHYLNYGTYFLRPCTSEEKLPSETHRNQNNTFIRVGAYKYQEIQILGKGYSSKVYKCYHISDKDKIYAIKVISLKKFKNSNLKLLENQLIIHKNLNHPNVLKCQEVYKTTEYYYIITQYCADGDLYAFIKRNKKIEEYQAAQILKQILSGFKYLTQKGVLHRDIKPANILKHGNSWKICDFGFAINNNKDEVLIDKFNVGTPLYMPLQSLKQNKYSVKSDIFGLGVIAFEMVTGKTPWESKNEKQLIEKLKNTKMKEPTNIKRQGKLMKFIMRACQVNENLRLGKQQVFQILEQKNQPNFLSLKTKKMIKLKSPTNTPTSQINCQYFTPQYKERQSQIVFPKPSTPSTPVQNPQKYFIKKSCLQASTQVSQNQSNPHYEQVFRNNSQKITAQLQTCRLIYYMVKNMNCFLILNERSKSVFTLGLLKYLLKFIKQLQDDKMNILSLRLWEQYKKSKLYSMISKEITNYRAKYENEYNYFVMKIPIQTLGEFNRQFRQLTAHITPLSSQFYKKFIPFICQNLRILNHEIMKRYHEQRQPLSIITISHNIQAMDSLYILYLILMNKSVGRECFVLHKVLKDYKLNNMTQQRYIQLRGKIRYL